MRRQLHEVGGRVDQQALGLETVASRASRLLLIVLDGPRCARMDDEAHVRPVDAHAERHRRDDDVDALSDERVLVPGALGLAEPRMVRKRGNAFGGQPRSQRIDLAPRRAVDDPGLLRVARQGIEQLPLQRGTRQRAVDEVRPIERSDELDGIHQTELRGDVAPHPRGGRRGVGVHADPGQPLPKLRQLTVLRSEVVSPLADAVRFVNRHEADAACREQRQKALAPLTHQPLGGDVQQAVAAIAKTCDDARFLRGRERAVVQHSGHSVADQRVHLVFHQRDQRGHHDRESRTHERRSLEAERLAAAGGQHDQRVAPTEHCLHRFALKWPERGVPPVACQGVFEG